MRNGHAPSKRGVGRQLRSEDGVALIVALGLLLVMLILMATAMAGGVFSASRAVADSQVKRAIEAADAGAKAATYRLSVITSENILQTTVPCLARVGGVGIGVSLQTGGLLSNGWCPAVTEDLGNGASFSYQVSSVLENPGNLSVLCALACSVNVTDTRTIVSTGSVCPPGTATCTAATSGAVSRRVSVTVQQSLLVVKLLGASLLNLSVLAPFSQVSNGYLECTAAAPSGAPPNNGC